MRITTTLLTSQRDRAPVWNCLLACLVSAAVLPTQQQQQTTQSSLELLLVRRYGVLAISLSYSPRGMHSAVERFSFSTALQLAPNSSSRQTTEWYDSPGQTDWLAHQSGAIVDKSSINYNSSRTSVSSICTPTTAQISPFHSLAHCTGNRWKAWQPFTRAKATDEVISRVVARPGPGVHQQQHQRQHHRLTRAYLLLSLQPWWASALKVARIMT